MVRFNEWVYEDVPRDELNVRNVSYNHMKEKTRKAELESHREKARQNLQGKIWFEPSYHQVINSICKCNTLDELAVVCGAYNLPFTWIKEEPTVISKEAELKLLKDQQAALLKRIERLEFGKWGREPSNGAVFKIEKKFSSTATSKYTYVALKANGMWYLTGTGFDATKAYNWEGLQKFAGQWARVWRLTVAEELLD